MEIPQYEIIGARRDSGFRVPTNYFQLKLRFAPWVDPTTGGPLVVVYGGTDTPVPGAWIDGNAMVHLPAVVPPAPPVEVEVGIE